jgi:hypothetical protein
LLIIRFVKIWLKIGGNIPFLGTNGYNYGAAAEGYPTLMWERGRGDCFVGRATVPAEKAAAEGCPTLMWERGHGDCVVGRATVPAEKAAAEGCPTLVGKKTARIVLWGGPPYPPKGCFNG